MERLTDNTFDSQEMALYGLDPDRLEDREEWLSTAPPEGAPVAETDYTQDIEAFGEPKPQSESRRSS